MQQFSKKIIISFLLFVLFSSSVLANKKDEFKKVIKPSSKKIILTDLDREIARNKEDSIIDELIQDRYGDEYRRANVYDLYPMEIPKHKARFLDRKAEVELMDYYLYARKNLEKMSKSKLLKAEHANFDLDGDLEYSVVLFNKKNNNLFLAIFNKQEELYFKKFDGDIAELVNSGKYPAGIFDDKKLRTLHSPTLRIVDFGEYSKILYYDKKNESWELEEIHE